jgi:hypothetical protein
VNEPTEREAAEMVRVYYAGRPGELRDPRLAGVGRETGQAVDMPRALAEEMVGLELFARSREEALERGQTLEEGGEPMQAYVEIGQGGGEATGEHRSFVEIREEQPEGAGEARPLATGEFPGMGKFKLDTLARAGVGNWQTLAALSDEACEILAGRLAGISSSQLKEWRDVALAGLTREAMDRD